MFASFFRWFRLNVRDAFLGGVQDAVAVLDTAAEQSSGPVLQITLTVPAVPALTASSQPASDEPADVPVAAGNGKSRRRS